MIYAITFQKIISPNTTQIVTVDFYTTEKDVESAFLNKNGNCAAVLNVEKKTTIPHLFSGDVDGETPQEVFKILTALNCAPIGVPADTLPVFGFLDDDAYEASAFFILFSPSTFKFYEIVGSHCSCHGFEYQFEPSEITLEYLQMQRNWPNMENTILSVVEIYVQGQA